MRLSQLSGTFASAALAVIACSTCPVCLSIYASVLSTLGVGFCLTEEVHGLFLGGALLVAIGLALLGVRKHGRWLPVALTGFGGTLLLLSHFYFDHLIFDLSGTVLLVAGNFLGARFRRYAHAHEPCAHGCSHAHHETTVGQRLAEEAR